MERKKSDMGIAPIILNKEKLFCIVLENNKHKVCIYKNLILEIDNENKIIKKEELSENKKNYYKDDSCQRQDVFFQNKRKCNPCPHLTYCGCYLNSDKTEMDKANNPLENKENKENEQPNIP